ncbi:MAG: hypothetical protein LBG47_05250 [Prevotellaceae bacterium]|jgi:hypothetical protein|nr:hypothetical protein [Prevotellaceae bacterium]
MVKKFENIVEIDSRRLFDEVSAYCDTLIDEATAGGFLNEQEADNEYTREIGRVANLCAEYEDTKMPFNYITVRGRSPLVMAVQAEMFMGDATQKGASKKTKKQGLWLRQTQSLLNK